MSGDYKVSPSCSFVSYRKREDGAKCFSLSIPKVFFGGKIPFELFLEEKKGEFTLVRREGIKADMNVKHLVLPEDYFDLNSDLVNKDNPDWQTVVFWHTTDDRIELEPAPTEEECARSEEEFCAKYYPHGVDFEVDWAEEGEEACEMYTLWQWSLDRYRGKPLPECITLGDDTNDRWRVVKSVRLPDSFFENGSPTEINFFVDEKDDFHPIRKEDIQEGMRIRTITVPKLYFNGWYPDYTNMLHDPSRSVDFYYEGPDGPFDLLERRRKYRGQRCGD